MSALHSNAGPTAWHLISGEYPPQLGGVSDYTRQVASALARAGERVHVWAPVASGPTPIDPGVEVHRLQRRFSPRGLRKLGEALDSSDRPRRLLVQYVPQAFGYHGFNLPFCLWLTARREPLWLMLHEVVSPWGDGHTLKRDALAAVTRLMALLAVKRADRVLVSVPAWRNLLATFLTPPELTWLPVPTCLPTEPPVGSKEACARLRTGHAAIIGHFGTYSPLITPLLRAAFLQLLRSDHRRLGLLLGRGSDAFAAQFLAEYPDLNGQVKARAGLAPEDVAASLCACDVILQPYPDGISARRTTAMASLALGLPVVTNAGPLSEPLWSESGAVALTSEPSGRALAGAVEALLESPGRRADLGERGRALYGARFSLQRSVETLRDLARKEEMAARQ